MDLPRVRPATAALAAMASAFFLAGPGGAVESAAPGDGARVLLAWCGNDWRIPPGGIAEVPLRFENVGNRTVAFGLGAALVPLPRQDDPELRWDVDVDPKGVHEVPAGGAVNASLLIRAPAREEGAAATFIATPGPTPAWAPLERFAEVRATLGEPGEAVNATTGACASRIYRPVPPGPRPSPAPQHANDFGFLPPVWLLMVAYFMLLGAGAALILGLVAAAVRVGGALRRRWGRP